VSTLPVRWSSNVDGFLRSGLGAVNAALKTPGAHTLTARATDKDNMSAQAVVHVTVAKPDWSIKIAVTDLGGQPVALTGNLGVLLQGRQGDVYVIKAKPSAPSNQAQPPAAQ